MNPAKVYEMSILVRDATRQRMRQALTTESLDSVGTWARVLSDTNQLVRDAKAALERSGGNPGSIEEAVRARICECGGEQ
jgi:hypothetical protein